jgi:PilY1 beta-propeller domain
MATHTNSRYMKVAALLVVVSTMVYAVFNFDPSSQPLVTLAPYGLKSYDLSTPNNKAYRPWLENGAYQGDVIEHNIDLNGNRTTDAPLGLNPITDAEKTELYNWGTASIAAAGEDSRQNWMARATFYAKECTDSICSSYTDYWKNRNIFTYNGGKIDFTWNALSNAQKQALDPAAYDPNGDGDTSDMLAESEVLNYVRGDHINEKLQPNGTLRSRYSLLGDIVNSSPVYIGQPVEHYTDQDFQDFKQTYTTDFRDDLVVIGANDGMLHVFDADDGSEVYAYIPSMLIGTLSKLAVTPPYQHTYYVDGRLTVASAKIDTDWKTVLTGGLGAGGKGLFALDMTSETPDNHSVLFEKSSAEFGYIYGQPTIYGMAGGDWYVITGNGYGAGRAKLLFVNLKTNGVTAYNTTDSDASAGLSEPSLIDFNNDQIGDYVYAGDTKGDMWKFDFTDPANVVVSKIYDGSPDQPITTAPSIAEHPNGGYMVYFATGNASSLTDASDPNYPTQAIYGIWDQATGSTIVEQTLGEATATFSTTTTVDNGDGTTSTVSTGSEETVRYVANDPFTVDPDQTYQYICPASDNTCTAIKGWKVVLGPNERLIGGSPQLRAGRVTLVTNNPNGINTDTDTNQLTPDLEGDGWLMTLDYLTGSDAVGTERGVNGGVALNLSGDDLLNEDDMISVNGVLKAPVGLRLGEGVISQPAIARLGPDIDIMYINGLKLKLPQIEPGGPFFNGHIDVVTDSPGPNGGSKAPNDFAYMSEGYNVTANDGYGKAVDGLVHEYSDINGITYVDLFELEPRRGMTSKDGTPFPPENGSCLFNPAWTVGVDVLEVKKSTGELYGCVVTNLDAELNRAYDAYTVTVTDDNVDLVNGTCPANGGRFGPFYKKIYANGTLDHCEESIIDPKSEAYLLGGTTPIPKDKQFIVTLANADLSTAGILQIGCRTWRAEEYQDMITSQLESNITPANLADTTHGLGAGSLLFTLNDITTGAKDYGYACPEDSKLPTLRVSFEQRSILDLGIVGTRSQCVLGLHQPEDKVCYADAAVLTAAESTVPKIASGEYTPDDSPVCGGVADPWGPPSVVTSGATKYTYLQDPARNWHITWNPNYAGFTNLTGFRWRNGALSLQLLDATGGAKNFTLQPANTLLKDKNGARKGGTFAKAFDAAFGNNGKLTGEITNRDSKGPNESGLLYEADMYWHYGRLADDIRTSAELGSGNPSSTPCYGGNNYTSRLGIEASGANPGEINRIITKEITDDQLTAYFQALQAVKNCGDNQTACAQALLELAQLLADDPDLALLDSILPYVNLDDLNLPPGVNSGNDSTPNRDVEALDLEEGVKPQYIKNQRRSWIDLQP